MNCDRFFAVGAAILSGLYFVYISKANREKKANHDDNAHNDDNDEVINAMDKKRCGRDKDVRDGGADQLQRSLLVLQVPRHMHCEELGEGVIRVIRILGAQEERAIESVLRDQHKQSSVTNKNKVDNQHNRMAEEYKNDIWYSSDSE